MGAALWHEDGAGLGLCPRYPLCPTLHTIFRSLDCDLLARKLSAWAAQVIARVPPALTAAGAAGALAGNTLRGSRKQGAPGVHRLSALSPHVGLTRAQQAVSNKTNEMTPVEAVLRQLVLRCAPRRPTALPHVLEQRRTHARLELPLDLRGDSLPWGQVIGDRSSGQPRTQVAMKRDASPGLLPKCTCI